jgi:hypothetical protein
MNGKINEKLQKLQNENETLRNHLSKIHQVLMKVFKQRKEGFLENASKTKQKDPKDIKTLEKKVQYVENFNLLDFKKDLFHSPFEQGLGEVLEVIEENLKRVQEFFDRIENEKITKDGDHASDEEEEQEDEFSFKNIKEVRNLLSKKKFFL